MNCNGSGVIVRYSTPTIKITFNTIDPTTIIEAYLVLKRAGAPVLTKDLTTATVHQGTEQDPGDWISWTLTQQETGALAVNSTVTVYCDWKLTDETRGRSHTKDFRIAETGKDEVI